jgi:hypothetical protein
VSEERLLRQVWEAVGLFALSESLVNDLIDSYTAQLPAALVKAVVKRPRHLSADERKAALRAILDDRGLTAVYPDLVALYGPVATRRDSVAHCRIFEAPPGSFRPSGEVLTDRPTKTPPASSRPVAATPPTYRRGVTWTLPSHLRAPTR